MREGSGGLLLALKGVGGRARSPGRIFRVVFIMWLLEGWLGRLMSLLWLGVRYGVGVAHTMNLSGGVMK